MENFRINLKQCSWHSDEEVKDVGDLSRGPINRQEEIKQKEVYKSVYNYNPNKAIKSSLCQSNG